MTLPDGDYPFIDRRFPLADLQMVEAPAKLEALLKAQAAANGIMLIREALVELRFRSDEFPDATFLIWWRRGTERIHMLIPKAQAIGRA